MRKESIHAVLLVLLVLALPSGVSAQQKFGRFDRLAVVQRFLDEVYPDLKHVYGLLTARSEAFHLIDPQDFSRGGLQVDVAPCRPGSGVPGGGAEPQRPRVPHCTGLFLPSFSEFLTMSVGFSDKFPNSGLQARGSFVEAKGQAAKQEIWDHPEWGRLGLAPV
jgi:hypothetical protein